MFKNRYAILGWLVFLLGRFYVKRRLRRLAHR
jgi:hypothetical protein